ncbi:DUF2334 domain-containing protein [Anianabacter salinae]|uniref:DUF2334 domain-containing protein n=1 Tax=Anianabacter salinae TaxID=2851023 RepID=UPI00225DDBFB|nr:DUF2334 domain-containing protein [Anianabacter salinae]MBV0912352.1 DUF2334 domain-containing protein [Anianabacter salinae]
MTAMQSQPTITTARARGGWRKLVLPEVHDIYPGMTPTPEDLAAMFPKRAQGLIALSIVPDWQGRAPIADAQGFAAKIGALGGARVLHGLTHSLGPSWIDWLVYGHDNRSEFRSLSETEAHDRLTKGIAAFETTFGARPDWFCAPRWQESAGTLAALKALGFAGTLSRTRITRFGAPDVPLPTLNFDEGERSLPIALAMTRRRRAIARLLASEAPFRLVIHPHDLLHSATRAQLAACLAALDAAGWEFLSLESTLARWDAQ